MTGAVARMATSWSGSVKAVAWEVSMPELSKTEDVPGEIDRGRVLSVSRGRCCSHMRSASQHGAKRHSKGNKILMVHAYLFRLGHASLLFRPLRHVPFYSNWRLLLLLLAVTHFLHRLLFALLWGREGPFPRRLPHRAVGNRHGRRLGDNGEQSRLLQRIPRHDAQLATASRLGVRGGRVGVQGGEDASLDGRCRHGVWYVGAVADETSLYKEDGKRGPAANREGVLSRHRTRLGRKTDRYE